MKKSGYSFGKSIFQHRALFISYLFCVPLAAVASILFSMCLQPLVDVIYSRDMDAFFRACVISSLCLLLDVLTHYVHKIIREKMRVHYITGLKHDLFHGIIRKSIKDYHTTTHAQYMSVINRDVSKMSELHYDAWCGLYRVLINFIFCIVMIILINPWIALLNLLIGAISAWIPRVFEKKLMEKQEKASTESEQHYHLLSNYLRGFTTIRLFRIMDDIENKMDKSSMELEKSNYDSTVLNYSVTWFSQLLSQFGYILTIALGVFLSVKGSLTIGTVMALSQMIGGILVPFEELPEYLTNLRSVSAVKTKISNLITQTPEQSTEKQQYSLDDIRIDLKQAGFSYEEKNVFSHVNLEMKSPGKYIMIGKSGTGKTTLANLIMGFDSCTSGQITVNGRHISGYDENDYYKAIAYLEQDVFLFDDTIYNNITLFSDYAKEQIQTAVTQAGLTQMIGQLPLGLQTKITGNGENVSGGERQRIGIARALLTGAKFIILDEITTGLDPVQQREIEHTVMSLKQTGILMITHHWAEELLQKADGILCLQDHSISMCDTFEQLQKTFFSS